jgi:hypothetical protein
VQKSDFSKDVGMFIPDNAGMGLYFEGVDGRWWTNKALEFHLVSAVCYQTQ